ncbi:MAG: MarR family winged helix-turn-helix transcriptional regulator [Oscillospiraceae bacterium]|jgi:DNA-binding MarR family transcriptional regulator|nr:MarR family winged helix-turn-helix transcriptional regulator [Oscillospiraceae bacterium]
MLKPEGRRSLESAFRDVYKKFKLQFYKKIFGKFETREASLSAVETFCVEAVHALGEPTVNEFARFVSISPANAAYKVQNLIEKGYVTKERSASDRREYHLRLTERFYEYYSVNTDYVEVVAARIRERFSPQETAAFEYMLNVIADELMPEIPV